MPIPSRDRLPRPVDISTLYWGAARRVGLMVDKPGLRWKGLSGNGPGKVSGGNNSSGGQGWIFQQTLSTGRENRRPGLMARRYGGRRGRGSRFPFGYPRAPLRDITAIVRAIERRRAEVNNTIESLQEVTNEEPLTASSTELEEEIGSQTPLPTVSVKPLPAPSQIKPKVADNNGMGSDSLTPQKRLLNSIDNVREIWLEDQKRLSRTPAAKWTERQKRIRILKLMR